MINLPITIGSKKEDVELASATLSHLIDLSKTVACLENEMEKCSDPQGIVYKACREHCKQLNFEITQCKVFILTVLNGEYNESI